ncbi:MAG TPA: hypothetical protein VFQ88_10380 [Nevskiaceae bacterium]|nr:hypothetical protein [Nevskiaceae bacterium]
MPLRQVLWSFARGEGKGEVIGALVIVVGMGIGLGDYQQTGGLIASVGVVVFFVGRFMRRVRQHMNTPRR